MEKRKILVTGGAGFIGSHLVDALLERGHAVRVLDSLIEQVHPHGVAEYLNPAAEFVRGDVCGPEAVRQALEGVDAVFHQAAEVGVGQSMYEPERYMRTNTLGTTVLMAEICRRKSQVRKVVVASSMSIYGEGQYSCAKCGTAEPETRSAEDLQAGRWELQCPACRGALAFVPTREDKRLRPNSVYAISKQDQEQLSLVMGRAYGVPVVALRYFNGYGTRQALSNPYTGVCAIFCARLLNGRSPMVFEDGRQTRDFVHVSDIVQANLLALENSAADYQAVNVGSGSPITIREIAAMLARKLGKNIPAEFTGQTRVGDIRHCVADITRAHTLLGYQPQVRLEEGMDELIGWVAKQAAVDRVSQASAELAAHKLVHSASPAA